MREHAHAYSGFKAVANMYRYVPKVRRVLGPRARRSNDEVYDLVTASEALVRRQGPHGHGPTRDRRGDIQL